MFQVVLRGFQGYLKEVSMVFYGSVEKRFQRYFKIVSRKIEGYWEGDFSGVQ